MEQPAFITNERLNEFCKHQQAIEDKLSKVADDLKELKDAFNKMVVKMDERCDGICSIIGEVPKEKTVMQCIRENNARTDRMWWSIVVVFSVLQFLANFPKIATLFN